MNESKSKWKDWLSKLDHTKNADGTIDVKGNVYFHDCDIKHFPFKFGKVSGSFDCRRLPKLVSLEGAPHTVSGLFICSEIGMITSLKYGPTIVRTAYACRHNPQLISLEGAPQYVGGAFWCADNPKLKSLKGLPKAASYKVDPFTQADVERELERQDLEKHMSPTAKEAWGVDTFADL